MMGHSGPRIAKRNVDQYEPCFEQDKFFGSKIKCTLHLPPSIKAVSIGGVHSFCLEYKIIVCQHERF